MPRPKNLDRAKARTGRARKRTSITVYVEAEDALKLYAGSLDIPKGRKKSVSLAIEDILYSNQAFRRLVNEVRNKRKQLVERGEMSEYEGGSTDS